jgi:hypothetical protein
MNIIISTIPIKPIYIDKTRKKNLSKMTVRMRSVNLYKGEKARLQYSGVRVEYKRSTAEYSGVRMEYKWSTDGVQWSTSGVREVRWSTGVPESRLFPLAIFNDCRSLKNYTM